jgi:hypothetical protein
MQSRSCRSDCYRFAGFMGMFGILDSLTTPRTYDQPSPSTHPLSPHTPLRSTLVLPATRKQDIDRVPLRRHARHACPGHGILTPMPFPHVIACLVLFSTSSSCITCTYGLADRVHDCMHNVQYNEAQDLVPGGGLRGWRGCMQREVEFKFGVDLELGALPSPKQHLPGSHCPCLPRCVYI